MAVFLRTHIEGRARLYRYAVRAFLNESVEMALNECAVVEDDLRAGEN